jgi:phosphonoacetaldehyde hydrolase
VKRSVDRLRAAGIKVGCDTGYPIEACTAIYEALDSRHGIRFDVVADPENTRGRPTPFLVYDCMYKANAYPPAAVVKADDITAGVEEGANSGAWTVGLYATGAHDWDTLRAAGADYLVPGSAELADLVFTEIQPRLLRGGMPGEVF